MARRKGPKKLESKPKAELLKHIKNQESLSFDMAMLITQLMDLIGVDSLHFDMLSTEFHGFDVVTYWKKDGCNFHDEMSGSAALHMILGAAIAKQSDPNTQE